MKTILFFTETLRARNNGPSIFANYIKIISKNSKKFKIKIITDDINIKSIDCCVYKIKGPNIKIPFCNQLFRQWKFYLTYRHFVKNYNNDQAEFVWFNTAFMALFFVIFPVKSKIVVNVNDYTLATLNTPLAYKNFYGIYRSIAKYYYRLIEKFVLKYADKIVVNSKFTKKKIIKQYNLNNTDIFVLYKAVDYRGIRNFILNNKFPLKTDKLINVLFIKTDFMLGGVDIMLNYFSNIEEPILLNIVGPNKENRKIKKIAKAFNMNEKVKLWGKVDREILYSLYMKCDIMCNFSRKEALGVALIEAKSFNLPIIAPRIGGIPEAIGNYRNIYWFELMNKKSFIDAFRNYLKNRDVKKHYNYDKRFSLRNLNKGINLVIKDLMLSDERFQK